MPFCCYLLGGLLSLLKENEGEVDLREKGRREYTGRDIIYERRINLKMHLIEK